MDNSKQSERKFPPLYEKLIPVALIFLAILIVGMLILTIGVALGW
ncbi:MAG TPA: hypothetical protein PK530_16955 [Anaerolineales bacterium]|nr:hypothetical protein [Anaerolineales bacterium]